METLFFILFAALAIAGSLATVWLRYVVHSAFALMAAFLGVAGLFILLGADFIAVSQVLIYVGGILILILFGIMLTPPDKKERSVKRVLGFGIPVFAIVGGLAFQIGSVVKWVEKPDLPIPGPTAAPIGRALLKPDGYLVPFELVSIVLLVALIGSVFIARRRTMQSIGATSQAIGGTSQAIGGTSQAIGRASSAPGGKS
ncbi:MAG: NADH-quinone oxidoreductase subunit J [Planctomycetes bacterium]|nr:NADH-quinone oxidoreductase subunit J [Planctomycetota bacterium]